MFANPLTERLADFVRGIGIDVRPAQLPGPTFLPGIDVRDGILLIEEQRLAYPGDVLHEAGHLAVTDPAERTRRNYRPRMARRLPRLPGPMPRQSTSISTPQSSFIRTVTKAAHRRWSRPSRPGAPSASRCFNITA
jgi:hypothetical protein